MIANGQGILNLFDGLGMDIAMAKQQIVGLQQENSGLRQEFTEKDDFIRLQNEEIEQLKAKAARPFSLPLFETKENEMDAMSLIVAERKRQQEVEGWSAEHDDAHADGSLFKAAKCYMAFDP